MAVLPEPFLLHLLGPRSSLADWQSLGPEALSGLVRGLETELLPLLWSRLSALRGQDLPDQPSKDVLQRVHRQAIVQDLMMASFLSGLTGDLQRAGIVSALVKGPALGRLIYPQPEVRLYSDIDILIPPSSLPRARPILAQRGYRPRAPRPRLEDEGLTSEAWFIKEGSFSLDIQLGLTSLPAYDEAIDLAPILGRARELPLWHGCQPVPLTLDPYDTLIFLLFHLHRHLGQELFKVKWLLDLDYLFSAGAIDAQALAVRCRELGVAAPVYYVLQLVQGRAEIVPPGLFGPLKGSPSFGRDLRLWQVYGSRLIKPLRMPLNLLAFRSLRRKAVYLRQILAPERGFLEDKLGRTGSPSYLFLLMRYWGRIVRER